MKHLFGMGMAAVLLTACQGPQGIQGEVGPPGPQGTPAPPPVIAANSGLTGNGTTASPLAVAAGGITATHLAGAARIYSRFMTPRWLQANADIHSARVATFTNTDVSFGAAGAGNNNTRLFTVPLLSANTLKAGETYRFRVVVNQVVASSDNDPMFGFTDGTTYFAIEKDDVNNPQHSEAIIGPYANNMAQTTDTILGNPGQNAETFELVFQMGPAGASTSPVYFNSRIGTVSGRLSADVPFDRTAAISFAVFANNDVELYTFTGFEVTIDREG